MNGENIIFEKNIKITGKIQLITGLHIGSVTESMKIGGTDTPVMMDYLQMVPMIPGSSLKGKMRSLIELSDNDCKYKENGEVHSCTNKDCKLCLIFGRPAEISEKLNIGPTRLIVRDCFPDEDTREKWKVSEDIVDGTEIKMENWINRLTSAASPRTFERVPAGSKFDFEMMLSVYNGDDERENLKFLIRAMEQLQDSYLGGSGSRGYGNVEFFIEQVVSRGKEDYIEGQGWNDYKINGESLKKLELRELRRIIGG